MNAATKTKWAGVLGTVILILTTVQTFVTAPPLSVETAFRWGAILTYATLAATAWRQYLSPDISNTAAQATIWTAVIATVAGLLELIPAFDIPEALEQKIRWGITLAVAIFNSLSSRFLPSRARQELLQERKHQV
jgi:hypothetical protein